MTPQPAIREARPGVSPCRKTRLHEVPRPAPGVRLIGEQPGTGFQDSQWLVERDGRYVQLSELLYRVIEQIDGQRTLESIAAATTASSQWTVTAEHVRELLATKLIPAGLAAEPGSAPTDGVGESLPRSPLRVKVRRVLIGRHVLDSIARFLQVLYAPPLLVPLLALIAFVHGWLYVDHGIAAALAEVLLQPALILAVGAIFLATTVFHEFGHAAALRYAGGKVRGMGAGVYLIYPVLFTDTTDAYRLGRWARVRIDLGGFYFQSFAAVVLIGLVGLSGWEWLLVPVFLINLETARQLLFPFVRLDGYWLFADLTGIPDFFSHLKPFLRSLVPRARAGGPRLPALKRLPKAVFIGYVIVAIPVLSFLLVQFAIHSPGIMETAWNSILAQKAMLLNALAAGDLPAAASSLGQLLILTMPALAGVVLALILATWLASVLWRTRRGKGGQVRQVRITKPGAALNLGGPARRAESSRQ
jgi:putative peptide zinc metalloprotease protein